VIGRRDDTSSLEQLGQHKPSTSGCRPCPRPHEGSTADPGPERAVGSRQDRERSSTVTSKRKQAREFARWEADTRTWAMAGDGNTWSAVVSTSRPAERSCLSISIARVRSSGPGPESPLSPSPRCTGSTGLWQ
jgi:hypothetical protein